MLFQKKLIAFSFLISLALMAANGSLAQEVPYKWPGFKIGGGGYVTGIVIHAMDKNIMYIRTDVGGAYRWNAAGKEWVQLLNWVGPENSNLAGVDGMALDPQNPDRIYLALGKNINAAGGVFRSEDRGETWKLLFASHYEGNGRQARWIGECLAVDPNNGKIIYAGTRRQGLWRSTDDGKNWSKVSSIPDGYTGVRPTGVRTIVFDPAEQAGGRSSVVYIGVLGSGIYQSLDAGKSFTLMQGSPQNPARMQVINRELFVTHDTGVSLWCDGKWQNISPVQGKNYVGLAVDETDNRKIVAAQRYSAFYNPIFRSNDKGKTWEQINTKAAPAALHVNIPWWSKKTFSSATAGMAFAPRGAGELYYTDWFGVWHTPNVWADSTDWYTRVKGHEETVVLTLVSPPSGALVYSGMADVSGFKHTDTAAYPAKKIYPLNECFSISVCEKKPANIAILGAKSWGGEKTTLVTSADFGETWSEQNLPERAVLGKIALSSDNPKHMVYLSGSGNVYHSQDGGKSWKQGQNVPEKIIEPTDIWNKSNALAADMANGSFYIFKDGILYASADGNSWEARNKTAISKPSGGYYSVTPAPGKAGEVWISLDKNGLWRTSDGGITFSRVPAFEYARVFSWGAPEPGSTVPAAYCYGTIGDKWGLYRSVDMGKNWVRINDDKHQFPGGVKAIAGDRNIFGRVYVGTGGLGILYGRPVK